MRNKLIMNEAELQKLSRPKLVEHVVDQVEKIDRLKGYDSGVSKYKLINSKTDALIKIALENNKQLVELNYAQ